MAIVNGYCTLADLKAHRAIQSLDAADDQVLERIIEDASRLIDAICGRWFYAYTQTRRLSLKANTNNRSVMLGEDCLGVTTLTNGDGVVVAPSDYILEPYNHPVKERVTLKRGSNVTWQQDAAGNTDYVVEVAGSWGYVNRVATDPYSLMVVANTRSACILIANQMYQERNGNNVGGSIQVTGAGVVITPYGAVPKAAMDAIRPYVRQVFATTDDIADEREW